MQSDLVLSLVVGVLIILLVVLSRWRWRGAQAPPVVTKPPRATRDPKVCRLHPQARLPRMRPSSRGEPSASDPHAPPPRMICTRGRRHVETTKHSARIPIVRTIWPSTSGIALWPWPHAWCIRSRGCWPRTVLRCFSPNVMTSVMWSRYDNAVS
jgi:hypothetical protein